jgi:uncharacterized protein YbbC (DUF1343 family)
MSLKNKVFLPIAAVLTTALCLVSPGCRNTSDGSSSNTENSATRYSGPTLLGIDVLEKDGFAALADKRVGLITNQTSVNRRGTKTRVVLHRAPQVNLVALFTPEHGLDGTEKAAAHISTRRDSTTGLIAHSLYGPTRKPTAQMLSTIDVLLFDLQDIGSRSYTYISTMILAMEACAQYGKEFVVLDRPNPLGGLRVQGPPLEKRWVSFVGQIPVPYVHGMTAGELAKMANSRGWFSGRCRLSVVPMRGWTRNMVWSDTRLRWVPTSPNIPNADSPFYYAATGIFGSLTGGDIGIGTSAPFEYAGGPGIDPTEFTAAMKRFNTPGVSFSPYRSSRKPGHAGVRIRIDKNTSADLVALNLIIIDEINKRIGHPDLFDKTSSSSKKIFYKVYGSNSIETQLKRGVSPGSIIGGWKSHNDRFLQNRQPYLLYR